VPENKIEMEQELVFLYEQGTEGQITAVQKKLNELAQTIGAQFAAYARGNDADSH
jgi:hypothetical protein